MIHTIYQHEHFKDIYQLKIPGEHYISQQFQVQVIYIKSIKCYRQLKIIQNNKNYQINLVIQNKSFSQRNRKMNAYRQSLIESQLPDSLQKLKISSKKIKSLVGADPYQNLVDLVTIKNINRQISKKRTFQNHFKESRLGRIRKQQQIIEVQKDMIVMTKKLSNSQQLSKVDLSQKYVLKIKRGYKFSKQGNQKRTLQTLQNQSPSELKEYVKYNSQTENPQMSSPIYSPIVRAPHYRPEQQKGLNYLSKERLVQRISLAKKQRIKTLPKIKISDSSQKIQKNKNKPILSYFDLASLKMKSECFFMVECNLKQPNSQGRYIISHNGNKSLQIASLTKIMTFYAVWDIIKKYDRSLEENFIISEEIQDFPGTSAHLYQGEIYTIEQLLYALLLPSGNDAAISLAKWGGSILKGEKAEKQDQSKLRYFVSYMNKLSKQLELKQTNFDNSHGLSNPNNKSSCRDISKLCQVCIKIPLFVKICSTQYYKCKISRVNCKKKQYRQWDNTNKLLRRPNFIGLKTGITVTAGPCLASAYIFRQKVYITVLLRCNKISRRFKQTRYLLAHTLRKLYENQLSIEEQKQLKRLQKNNAQLDSDYSDQQRQFNFSKNDGKQFKKRMKILTEC